MKAFLKQLLASTLGTLFAIILIGAGGLAMLTLLSTVISSAQKMTQDYKPSILVIDLNTSLEDAPPDLAPGDALLEAFTSGGEQSLYLLETTRAIRRAGQDSEIRGILLHGSLSSINYGSGYPAVSELRNALDDFRAAGKPVYAYLEAPSLRDYYLATSADAIYLNPAAMLEIPGMAAQMLYLGEFLERNGIGIQVLQSGIYKSAIEPFTRTDMSEPARKQLTALMNISWESIRDEIAQRRKLNSDTLQKLADTQPILIAKDALESGLVDHVAHKQVLFDKLAEITEKAPATGTFYQRSLLEYIEANRPTRKHESVHQDYVAVVYAEGEIIHGKGFGEDVSDVILPLKLRAFRRDGNCRAVVLRVNSPGGSALASDIIAHELELLAEAKPLIISMGTYAASGGYWISLAGKRIFAHPLTITGSIGVFGLVPNIEGLANEYGMRFDGVKTAEHAAIFSIAHPRSEKEMLLLQNMVDSIYQTFVQKVSQGRQLSLETVSDIAQGRVWSGLQAQENKLVDELGGLDAAVAYAYRQAGLREDSPLVEYPRRRNMQEIINQMLEEQPGQQPLIEQHAFMRLPLLAELEQLSDLLRGLHDPRQIYARLPFVLFNE